MPQPQKNPAGKGGALDCLAGRLDSSEYSHNPNEPQFQPGADECIYRLGRALRMGRVRRQSFLDRRRPDLREVLAHLVGHSMRRICGVASADVRWSGV